MSFQSFMQLLIYTLLILMFITIWLVAYFNHRNEANQNERKCLELELEVENSRRNGSAN